ncbi:MAG: hypothetical protein ABH950_08005 [Candidatus Altiarchaeota archaeon]
MTPSSKTIRPFPFDSLPKSSKASVRLLGTLYEALPQFGSISEFHDRLESYASGQLGINLSLSLQDVSTLQFSELANKHLSNQSLYALVSLSPAQGRIVLEMDSVLTSVCVDQLMGGGGETEISRPLGKKPTEIDQGVVSYFLTKVLSHIYEWSGESSRLHFRLEELTSDMSQLDGLFTKNEECPSLHFQVRFGEKSGFVRLIFPASIIQKLVVKKGVGMSEREEIFFQERVDQLDFLSTELWADAGRTQLKVDDINKLEKGDIVLFDETELTIGPENSIEGDLIVRAGKGQNVAYPSTVISGKVGGKKITLRLEKSQRVNQ